MKVMHISYAGDFQEAYNRLIERKGRENYYAQRYSVESVVKQARRGLSVMVIVLKTDGYACDLEDNLQSVGLIPSNNGIDYAALKKEILAFGPDKVILRTPDPKILQFLRKNAIETLPVFADSFGKVGLVRGRLHRFLLSRELRNKAIRWIGNHQLNASRSLKALGVDSAKILPYDWEHSDSPDNWQKPIRDHIEVRELRIFYAGALTEEKGLFDLMEGAALLKKNKRNFELRVAGKGDREACEARMNTLGIATSVKLLGLIDHDSVLQEMNAADVVVVPSRHEYPEGLPMTIMESLMVHTPVIASDHPMFVGRVGNMGAVRFFNAANPESLSDAISKVCSNDEIYSSCVKNAPKEWSSLILDLKWAALMNTWIDNADPESFNGSTLKDIDG